MTDAKTARILSLIALTLTLGTPFMFSAKAQTAEKAPTGQQGSERMEAARFEVANVRSNIFLTLVELDRVRGERGPERPQFKIFTAQLGNMQSLAKAFGQHAEEMKSRGAAYFRDWESGLGTDPQKNQRYAERKQAYDAIIRFMQDAKVNFLDFNSILTQIKSLLENQPTGADVAKAKDLFGTANWRCIDVQKALVNMEMQFDRLAESFARDTQ